MARARDLASKYHLVIEPRPGLGFIGYSLEQRGVFGDGRTPEACVRAVLEAQAGMIAAMLEAGETPPPPLTEGKRAAQINIRVTPDEKLLLEHAAHERGFRNVSEFLRTTALGAIKAA